MAKAGVGVLGVVVALLALAQRLANYQNKQLAVTLAMVSAVAFSWLVGMLVRDGIVWVKTRKQRLDQEDDLKPKKIGFSEAVLARKQAIATCNQLLPGLGPILHSGIERQNEIQKRNVALKVSPRLAEQLNQIWIDHAHNLRDMTTELHKVVIPLKEAVEMWRQCEERNLEWLHRTKGHRPPEDWIDGYDAFVSCRNNGRTWSKIFANIEDQWDPLIREQHRDLDAAVTAFVAESGQIVEIFRDFDRLYTLMIDAVDKWQRRAWLRRFF